MMAVFFFLPQPLSCSQSLLQRATVNLPIYIITHEALSTPLISTLVMCHFLAETRIAGKRRHLNYSLNLILFWRWPIYIYCPKAALKIAAKIIEHKKDLKI